MSKRARITVQEAAINCLCQKTRIAARAVTRAYDAALRSTGLRSTQFTVLVAASVAGGIPLGQLAVILGLERTTLTRNLSALEKQGLIQIVRVDGRTRKVVISPMGADRLEKALPLWDRAQLELQRKLGEQEWLVIQASLAKLADAA
jgi:DNA-binding MarR family transcriptional regulator